MLELMDVDFCWFGLVWKSVESDFLVFLCLNQPLNICFVLFLVVFAVFIVVFFGGRDINAFFPSQGVYFKASPTTR